MLFNSLDFLLFFPIVTILFFALPHKFRWLLLLAASCFFYMYFIPVYILILFFTIIIDYYAGILIEKTLDRKKRKLFLAWSIVANVGVLAIFKYYNFFLDNINELAFQWNGHYTDLRFIGIALPIGLSFHTFQAMSYTFEIYYGRQKAEHHFGYYALYVMFYPQLVAGPIERPQNILHQFHEKKYFDYERVRDGLATMLWGLFKKIVIADNLSGMVSVAFDHPNDQSGMTLLMASYFFAIQIYCDFSGYSDIAIGAAKVMGYDLMENFRTPYVSKSIREFWSRWHISLSTWFRDYLYIPLGGNRVKKWRWMLNLFIVFLVSGIWHGANWTFIIWGGLHGLYLVFGIIHESIWKPKEKPSKINSVINVLITFHLVLFAWIFFRAQTVNDAFLIISKIAKGNYSLQQLSSSIATFAVNPKYLSLQVFLMLITGFFLLIDPLMDQISKGRKIIGKPVFKYAVYSLLLVGILLFGFFGEIQFIYFQF